MLEEGTLPPAGYTLVGSTHIVAKTPAGRAEPMTVNVYRKD